MLIHLRQLLVQPRRIVFAGCLAVWKHVDRARFVIANGWIHGGVGKTPGDKIHNHLGALKDLITALLPCIVSWKISRHKNVVDVRVLPGDFLKHQIQGVGWKITVIFSEFIGRMEAEESGFGSCEVFEVVGITTHWQSAFGVGTSRVRQLHVKVRKMKDLLCLWH